jgi:hypothetical protein
VIRRWVQMKMKVEDNNYVNKEIYKNDVTFPHEVLTKFIIVMKTLNGEEEFNLYVENHLWSEVFADFSFMVNNSEMLAGGCVNGNEDIDMIIKYEHVLFPKEEEDELNIRWTLAEGEDVPSVEESYIKVGLRVEKDGKADIHLRDMMYKRLAEAFYKVVSKEDNLLSVEAFVDGKSIFSSLWKE